MQQRSQLLTACFVLSDIVVTACSWVGAYLLRFESGLFPITKEPVGFNECLRILPLVLGLTLLAFRLAEMYGVHRLRRFREEFVAVCKGTGLLTLFVMGAVFCLQDPYESRATMLLFFGINGVAVLAARRLGWSLIRYLRSRGYNQHFSIIVGTGRVARKTSLSLRRASWMGIKNLGYVEDKPDRWTSDLDILGTFADLPALIEKYQIRHVFIALPLNRFDEARRVFELVAQSFVEVRMVADLPNLAGVALTTNNLDGMPLIGLRESPHFGLNIVVKRTMDIVLASVGLVLLSPFLLFIAALVKLSSPGPVFHRQKRCSLNGKTFEMLKFRSMRVDAEATSGAVWAQKDDPRRTVLGVFLRKTSIDELPQLFNVLMGDMSLVGPRPERPEFTEKFSRTIPSYMARHCVKSGITGWAQVHGWRGNTSLRKRIQYDLYYITHWTPLLDLRILWMTLFHGLRHRNAY